MIWGLSLRLKRLFNLDDPLHLELARSPDTDSILVDAPIQQGGDELLHLILGQLLGAVGILREARLALLDPRNQPQVLDSRLAVAVWNGLDLLSGFWCWDVDWSCFHFLRIDDNTFSHPNSPSTLIRNA